MIKSIKTLSLPVPTRSENFNLFFQSLERAFLTKKINDEYKSEILINLLGERAHNVLLYIKEEELNDYEKLKSIVLREFQLTPREGLNSFKNAVKSSGETYIQFAARLTANFQYYCSLRKVNSFESLCDLIISDKLFETLNKETATHIGIREAEDWFRPIDLAKECDIYISSRSGSHKEIPITYGYTQDPFKNRSQNFKPKIKENYPQYHEREKIKIAIYAVIHLIAQETILLWSPWKYRCGQRTVRLAVVTCSQNQAVFARRRIKVKAELKLKKERLLRKKLGIRERKEERESYIFFMSGSLSSPGATEDPSCRVVVLDLGLEPICGSNSTGPHNEHLFIGGDFQWK
ncbi:integrase catalytic domain-containing protein [Trichonephila clavipes]|nr:integrase catalytic domain-containing protein [Trichonephila clavipes]